MFDLTQLAECIQAAERELLQQVGTTVRDNQR